MILITNPWFFRGYILHVQIIAMRKIPDHSAQHHVHILAQGGKEAVLLQHLRIRTMHTRIAILSLAHNLTDSTLIIAD